MLCSRRSIVSGAAALAVGCSRRAPPEEDAGPAPASAGWHDLELPPADGHEAQRAMVYAPPGSATWPVLVALHGRGEAGRGLERGARGWRDDYELPRAMAALGRGEVRPDDAAGMLPPERLAALNASLAAAPFRGLVVACPYTPVPTGPRREDAAPFARFLAEVLLPRIGALRGRPVTRAETGIDGVSMGGRYALLLGLAERSPFASVGALQPAIQASDAPALADAASRASTDAPFTLRLVSSEEDPFLAPTRALASALDERRVAYRLVVTLGPHDYAWNRGPGSIELLAHHERVLRGLPAP